MKTKIIKVACRLGKHMKTKIIKVACRLGKPFRISKGKDFSLKDVDGISRSGQRQIEGIRNGERQTFKDVAC